VVGSTAMMKKKKNIRWKIKNSGSEKNIWSGIE
jgi:hypothetical protein